MTQKKEQYQIEFEEKLRSDIMHIESRIITLQIKEDFSESPKSNRRSIQINRPSNYFKNPSRNNSNLTKPLLNKQEEEDKLSYTTSFPVKNHHHEDDANIGISSRKSSIGNFISKVKNNFDNRSTNKKKDLKETDDSSLMGGNNFFSNYMKDLKVCQQSQQTQKPKKRIPYKGCHYYSGKKNYHSGSLINHRINKGLGLGKSNDCDKSKIKDELSFKSNSQGNAKKNQQSQTQRAEINKECSRKIVSYRVIKPSPKTESVTRSPSSLPSPTASRYSNGVKEAVDALNDFLKAKKSIHFQVMNSSFEDDVWNDSFN